MEKVRFSNKYEENIPTPQCDLKYAGCRETAVAFYNIHGCATYYVCRSCEGVVSTAILRAFLTYQHLVCKTCGKQVSLPGYMNITILNKEDNIEVP